MNSRLATLNYNIAIYKQSLYFFSTTRGIISCILQQQKNNKYKSLDLHLDTELD